MPAIETADLHQTALLWGATGSFDDYGNPTISADYTEINVRWESGLRESVDKQGNTVAIAAVVVVDREIAIGSNMWLGSVEDLPGTSDVPESDIMIVTDYRETPDIKGRNYRRVVHLMRKGDTLSPSS